MKTTVIAIVGGLLLAVAGAAGGYYAAKATNPVPRAKAEERVDADRGTLTRNLVEVKADVAEIGSSIDPLTDLKKVARKLRILSATYLLETNGLRHSSTSLAERQCLQDADEAIEEAKTASMMWEHCAQIDDCGKKEFKTFTAVAVTKNDEAEGVLERCLAIFLAPASATASADK
jgi:hypothetical protein